MVTKLVNFWLIYEAPGDLASVENLLPGGGSHQEPPDDVQASVFKDAGPAKLRSLYRRYDDLSDIVPLREELQWLEDTYPDRFYAVGMWHFETGEPVGGVGSPWFRTPSWVSSYIPSGAIQDTVLVAGQAKRKFI